MSKKRFIHIIILLCLSIVVSSYTVRPRNLSEYDGEALEIQNVISVFSGSRELDSALHYARNIYRVGKARADIKLAMIGCAHIGQVFLMTDMYDSAKYYLSKGYQYWHKLKAERKKLSNYKPVYMIMNSMAIISANADMNYEQAAEYLIEGLNVARSNGMDSDYAVMGHNLGIVFFIRQNPAGMKYCEEVYQDGLLRNDRFMIYAGAQGRAMMFILKEQYKKANESLKEADKYLDGPPTMTLLNLHAVTEAGLGNDKNAEEYFLKAMDLLPESVVTDVAYLYLTYGQFLKKQGRFHEAAEMLSKGLEMSKAKNNHVFTYRLYLELSDIEQRTGNIDKSLEYYKLYHQESDSVFNIKRERAVNDLTMRYEEERYRSSLQEREILLMKKTRNIQVIVFILLIIIIVLGVLYLMYRHKDKLYVRIVKQYQQSAEREGKLNDEIARLKEIISIGSNKPDADHGSTALSADKNRELFSRLEELMKKDKIYHEPNLTRERVAELVGTNRTYLSTVINEQTGKSFIQYVNDYRIDEAVLILSNPNNDVLMKALTVEIGFSSPTTFYKFFREKVGMTPAKYKEKVDELVRISQTKNNNIVQE